MSQIEAEARVAYESLRQAVDEAERERNWTRLLNRVQAMPPLDVPDDPRTVRALSSATGQSQHGAA